MFNSVNKYDKQYELYLERVIKKGAKALSDFQTYLDNEIINHGDDHGSQIIQYFIYISVHPTLNLTQKSSLIQIFEHIVYVIKDKPQLTGYSSQLVGSILKFFNDPSQKIRYSAISSIYNIFKFLDDDCLFVFTRTFKQLPCIVTDPSSQVKQAALHLNHTMKTLLNNALMDNCDFDFEDFLNILTQNFLLPHPTVKQFLIDWINTLDEIKSFDSTKYLPLFLKKLFIFLVDQNKNVRNKANDCLIGFIDSFRLTFVCSKQHISNRYKLEDTQAILILLVKIIEESIIFEVSSEIDIHVLNWLESFSDFLIEEINLKLKPYLIVIFTNIFKSLFKVMIQVMSIENDNVRKTSARIHQNLLKAYPVLKSHDKEIQESAVKLKLAISTSKTLIKTQVLIKWIKQMGQQNNYLIHQQIQYYIISIIQKICESSQRNLSYLIPLLNNSIFTSTYYLKFLRTLIIHLQIKKIPNQILIIHKFLCFPDSDPVKAFVMICKQLNQLENIQKTRFKERMAEILFSFLIAQKHLSNFFKSILEGTEEISVIMEISKAFLENKGVYIGLAFLVKNYKLVIQIIEQMTQQDIQPKQITSIMKISNYLLNPAMHSIFIDIQKNNQQGMLARKAYLSLIMLLPINKYTVALKSKIQNLQDYSITLHQNHKKSLNGNQQYSSIVSQIYHLETNRYSCQLQEQKKDE